MRPDVTTSPNPIAQVTGGMTVIDADGAPIGPVIDAVPGDPNALTAQDPPTGAGVLAGKVPHTEDGDEPEVPADLAARLLRRGYLRVDARGVLGHDVYVEAGQVADVTPDGVRLSVRRDRLVAREPHGSAGLA